MDEPIRVFTATVLLASAAYVVLTNLQFRRQWPALIARCRQRVTSLGFDAALTGIDIDHNVMMVVATVGGAFAGALAGLLLNVSLLVASSAPRTYHTGDDVLVGAVFGALAFAILANER